MYGCGVDADFVGTGFKHAPDIVCTSNPAPYGERNEHLRCHGFHYVYDGVALVTARRDIQKGNFVGTLFVVTPCDFDWIAGITDIDESYALDDPPTVDVEAWNDAFSKAHQGAELPQSSSARI